MKFQFFNIPAQDGSRATNELNSFCAQHRISTIEKYFVDNGANSFWSICVTFLESEGALLGVDSGKRKKTIDYKEVLNDDDFTTYSHVTCVKRLLSKVGCISCTTNNVG